VSSPAALRVPVQSRSLKTRATLLEAARKEFDGRGYAPTTAKSIAERAAVGTGTFYHYFPDKDAVLREIARERAQALLDQSRDLDLPASASADPTELARSARGRLGRLVDLWLDYHRRDHGLHSVMTERRLCDPELDTVVSASEREAVQRLSTSLARSGHDGDTEAAAFMMFSLVEGAVHAHVLGQALLPDVRFRDGLVEALLRVGLPSAFVLAP